MNYDKLANPQPGNRAITGPDGRFLKGHSGNPAGRPPKSLMQRKLEEAANDPTFVDQWIEAAVKRSMANGVAGFLMSREILDRVDGPVKQEVSAEITIGLSETLVKARQRLAEE